MTDKDETQKLKHITFNLDNFDYTIISRMALNSNSTMSEVLRIIIREWIKYNSDLLEKNYGIFLREVIDEILDESYYFSLDKTLKPFEKGIIKELPDFFYECSKKHILFKF